jgi:hypothetical protein
MSPEELNGGQLHVGKGGDFGLERLAYFAPDRVVEFHWNMQANQGINLAWAHAF